MHTGLSLGYIHAGVTCTQDYHRGTFTRVSRVHKYHWGTYTEVSQALRGATCTWVSHEHRFPHPAPGVHTQGCHMHIGVSPGNMQRGVIYAHTCVTCTHRCHMRAGVTGVHSHGCHMHTGVSYAQRCLMHTCHRVTYMGVAKSR